MINLAFVISCVFIKVASTGYQGLLSALAYMLPYFSGNFAPFLLVTIFSALPELLLTLEQ